MTKIVHKTQLLVIEDDPSILNLLTEFLVEEGFLITTATNGQEALNLIQKSNQLPDLIILDYMMPILNGVQFRQKQKNDPKIKNIPVILMSADSHIELKGNLAGFDYYVKKPLDLDHFLELLSKCQSTLIQCASR